MRRDVRWRIGRKRAQCLYETRSTATLAIPLERKTLDPGKWGCVSEMDGTVRLRD
jgi:hypothetical protein